MPRALSTAAAAASRASLGEACPWKTFSHAFQTSLFSVSNPSTSGHGRAVRAAAFSALGLSPHAMLAFAFLCALIVITFIDLDHQIIPDVISLPGIAVGLAFSLVSPLVTPMDALLGALLGGGILLAVAWLYKTLRGQDGMGGGDVKLLAMIGAFLGWRSIFVTLFVGSVIGSVIGVVLMLYQRADT